MRSALILLAVLVLSSCGSPAPADRQMAGAVSVHDQWASAGDGRMAAVFGTLVNAGPREARIVSGSSPAAGMVEVHEVTGPTGAKTMRPKDGGLVLPPGGSHDLVPGGDHLMLMDLPAPLSAGTDVELTLQFEDGSTLPITVQVRDFAGADENYRPDHGSHG